MTNVDEMQPADGDPLNGASRPDTYWSTTNLSEAAPGVQTPLGWSVWGPASELGMRAAFHSLGLMSRRDRDLPGRLEDRSISIFNGRVAANVDFWCRLGDQMPGTSGGALTAQLFKFTPPGYAGRPDRSRWLVIAAKMPMTAVRAGPAVQRARKSTHTWWRAEIDRTPSLDLDGARQQFEAATRRFQANVITHITVVVCLVQPVYDQLCRLAARADMDPSTLMSGHGSHEESAVIEDMWELSRDRLSMTEFLARHGYHGPAEGEISATVWREDPAPVEALVRQYKSIGEQNSPLSKSQDRAADRARAERALLSRLPRGRRVQARIILRLADRCLALRGVGKVSFLQSLDVARAAARRTGECLVATRALSNSEDVFYLTGPELTADLPVDPGSVVATRRALRTRYQGLAMPAHWQGLPPAVTVEVEAHRSLDCLHGVGASAGVVEGRVRVVTDPSADEFEAGEILVAHTTDPGWASLMFLSSALVVDVGGLLSHAAVVGRELGLPCVMGVGNATRELASGDICRVDGTAGTVEILRRAEPSADVSARRST